MITGWLIFMSYAPYIKDFHFTYPRDGDYHFTAELKDGTKFRVFYNRFYKAEKNELFKSISEDLVPVLIRHLGPKFKCPSFLEYDKDAKSFFQLPLAAVVAEHIKYREKPKKSDLVVSCENLPKGAINVFLAITGKNNITKFPGKILGNCLDKNGAPWIYAGIHFFKN